MSTTNWIKNGNCVKNLRLFLAVSNAAKQLQVNALKLAPFFFSQSKGRSHSYNTVEPPNKGHFGNGLFCPLFGGCPYLGGSVV